MATHSSILAKENPMDRGALQATVHGITRVGHDLVTKPPPQDESRKQIDSRLGVSDGVLSQGFPFV